MSAIEDNHVSASGRRYRILGVIGAGGFGQVYRARLEGPNGFFKDVAIKLLKAEVADEEMLQRFRDEARILGLVRDRAIVGVDPPVRIAGRWAVVMDFVDGASAARLVKAHAFPPSVALEVVEEVARTLHKLYKHPGLDGQPLNILHRDLKPANIQITPTGEVKLLDFGIARADFSEREAATKANLGGTPGYIAPERLDGEESPAGDVYSLGVVLYRLVKQEMPNKQRPAYFPASGMIDIATDPTERVTLLADWMRCFTPSDRPSMKDVQDLTRRLRAEIGGESLRDWAERMVSDVSVMPDDELVGNVVTEMTRTEAFAAPTLAPPGPPPPGAMPPWAPAVAGTLAIVVVLSLVVVAGIVASGALTPPPPPAPIVVAPPPVKVEPPPVVAPPPVVVAAPVVEPPPVEPVKVAAKAEVKKAVPVVVAPVEPPAPAAKTADVTLGSVPLGAEVFVDGVSKGTTPLTRLALTEGTHQVKMVFGASEIVRDVRVSKRSATRFLWRVETGDWEAGY